ncbi:MAG: CHAT domain-containing protein [Pyrinomonadaceae bacterium]
MCRFISRTSVQSSGNLPLLIPDLRKLRATASIIVLLASLLISPSHLSTPTASAALTQTSQSPLERDLTVGDIHSYRLTLTSGQFMWAVVDQRGIDVVVALYGPDSKRLMEVDNPVGAWGPEPLFFEVKQSGSYKIEVRPRKTTSPPGRYKFSYEARQPTPEDQKRLPANRAFAEAARLMKAETARSRQVGVEKYEAARRLFHDAQDRRGEALALTVTGAINAALGDGRKALSYFNDALPLLRGASDMRDEEAMTLSRIAQVYQSLGERRKALDYFDQASQLFDAIDESRSAAYTLVNAGAVHDSMGENQKALDSFNEALSLFQSARDRRGEAYALNNIGLVYDALGDKQRSREAYARALALFEEINDCSEVPPTLSNLALDLFDSGDKQKALDYLNQALILQQGNNDRKGEATTLNNLGFLYNILGQPQKGLDYLQQALAIHREVRNRQGEGDSLSNMMLGWKSLARIPVAVFYGKGAVNVYQEVRAAIPPLDKEAQKSFLKSKEGTYRELADLLVERGRLPEAQQVLGLLKEEEYFQFVRRDGTDASNLTAPAALTAEEQDLADRYREISDHLATLGRQRAELLGKANRAPDEQRLLLKLEGDLNVANLEFQKIIGRISNELTASKQGGERVEQLKDTEHIVNILRELGAGSVALYTFVGEQKYSVILVTPDVHIAREYPIKASELYAKALAFREALEDPRRDARPLAQELYRILIAPVANDLRETRAETLMWSLDGILRYVPVAALHDGEKYMLERYRNTVFTPASTTRLTDQPGARWESLGLGVSKAQPGFQPLREVPNELRGIIREENAGQAGAGGVLPGKIRLDENFTKEEMDAALRQRKYAVVHIASHFKFEPGNETDSFLLLGDGTRLTLDQLRDSPDYFRGVDLLTLSACNTATSGAGADGKEVEGFAVLAQRQGAEAVIASLWPVADASTGLLMQKFYQIRSARPGTSKAEALRQAQMALINGEVKATDGKDYSHPNFWSPFILIGNWR